MTRNSMLVIITALLLCPGLSFAWGDEGHEIVGRIADHYLTPPVRKRVALLLAQDQSHLTRSSDIASEATWADKFRDSDRSSGGNHHRQTGQWHYINIELTHPDIDAACFHHPGLADGRAASDGPSADCIIDKIEQFRRELHASVTPPSERLLALQFLLHLVGDLHQPLHAADNQDRGGNELRVRSPPHRPGNLHHYWDTVFVEEMGSQSEELSQRLIEGITEPQRRSWSAGSATDWAHQSVEIAKTQVYGKLPPAGTGNYLLDADYVTNATRVVAQQLQRAGVRLAWVLNEDLR